MWLVCLLLNLCARLSRCLHLSWKCVCNERTYAKAIYNGVWCVLDTEHPPTRNMRMHQASTTAQCSAGSAGSSWLDTRYGCHMRWEDALDYKQLRTQPRH